MRSTGTLLSSLCALIFLLIAAGSADGAEPPSPLIVDADTVTYDQATQQVTATGNVRLTYKGIRLHADSVVFDLRAEQLTATGRVVLIDPQGRELRGETLTYDVRREQGVFTNTETVISKFFVRSAQVQTFGQRIVASDAMITTCDPDRPAYRITASRIEIIPGEQIIATQASLWIGSFRVFTLPVYTISLRSPEETARSFPSFGYNHVDGVWADYGYAYSLRSVSGRLYTKY
ncbi:MAG TPA: LptA/OstA family protein, partial [bacterium]|nr:LptA/OstA family protein [bacterium]